MEFLSAMTYFFETETPFMLLFSALFLYQIKTSKDREERMSNVINTKINEIQNEIQILIRVWKVLLEKELEDKKHE